MTKSKTSIHCMPTHEVFIPRSGAHDVPDLAVGTDFEGDLGLWT